MVKKKTIILNSEDLPSIKAVMDSISRLKKDFKLLGVIRGSLDTEEPDSFKSVISFLEMLVKREKKSFPKETKFVDNSMEVVIDLAAAHLNELDNAELIQAIENTDFKKVYEKYLFCLKNKGKNND